MAAKILYPESAIFRPDRPPMGMIDPVTKKKTTIPVTRADLPLKVPLYEPHTEDQLREKMGLPPVVGRDIAWGEKLSRFSIERTAAWKRSPRTGEWEFTPGTSGSVDGWVVTDESQGARLILPKYLIVDYWGRVYRPQDLVFVVLHPSSTRDAVIWQETAFTGDHIIDTVLQARAKKSERSKDYFRWQSVEATIEDHEAAQQKVRAAEKAAAKRKSQDAPEEPARDADWSVPQGHLEGTTNYPMLLLTYPDPIDNFTAFTEYEWQVAAILALVRPGVGRPPALAVRPRVLNALRKVSERLGAERQLREMRTVDAYRQYETIRRKEDAASKKGKPVPVRTAPPAIQFRVPDLGRWQPQAQDGFTAYDLIEAEQLINSARTYWSMLSAQVDPVRARMTDYQRAMEKAREQRFAPIFNANPDASASELRDRAIRVARYSLHGRRR